MPDAPTPNRTRLAAAAGLLGAAAVTALLLGVGPAPSALQLAGASDDAADDVSGNCDEAEHAGDPGCAGTPTSDGATSTTADDTTSTTAGGGGGATPADDVRSLDAAGAGTVIYAIEGGSLRLVTATPASGWAVEVEQGAGREVELDFRSGTRRVQVNIEIEAGQVRERVRVRDDADDGDIRSEDGVVAGDDSVDDNSNSGPRSGDDDSVDDDSVDDDNSGPRSGDDDSVDDDSVDADNSGSSHEDPDDDSGDDSSGPR